MTEVYWRWTEGFRRFIVKNGGLDTPCVVQKDLHGISDAEIRIGFSSKYTLHDLSDLQGFVSLYGGLETKTYANEDVSGTKR